MNVHDIHSADWLDLTKKLIVFVDKCMRWYGGTYNRTNEQIVHSAVAAVISEQHHCRHTEQEALFSCLCGTAETFVLASRREEKSG